MKTDTTTLTQSDRENALTILKSLLNEIWKKMGYDGEAPIREIIEQAPADIYSEDERMEGFKQISKIHRDSWLNSLKAGEFQNEVFSTSLYISFTESFLILVDPEIGKLSPPHRIVKAIKEVDDIWRLAKNISGENIKHPLAPMLIKYVENYTSVKITKETDKITPIAVLKHPVGSIRKLAFVDGTGHVFATPKTVEQVEQPQLLPDTSPSVLPSIMPLQVMQSHIKTQTKNGHVSHELRIFYEAMMALKPNQRKEELMFRLGDLIDFLYPNGKFQWSNQLPHIERALQTLHISATIPWTDDQGSLRQWRPVTVSAPLPNDANRNTPIFISVIMPPDARQGYMILKKIHRMTGMKSAAQWNAYHVACYLWDKHGTWQGKISDPTKPVERRDEQNRLLGADDKPIVTQRGKEITNLYHTEGVRQLDRETNLESVKKYPVLSWDDLIDACYPNGHPKRSKREYMSRAKKHWESLEKEGYIVIMREPGGWRILPPQDHINAYRALKTLSKKR